MLYVSERGRRFLARQTIMHILLLLSVPAQGCGVYPKLPKNKIKVSVFIQVLSSLCSSQELLIDFSCKQQLFSSYHLKYFLFKVVIDYRLSTRILTPAGGNHSPLSLRLIPILESIRIASSSCLPRGSLGNILTTSNL